MPQRDLRTSGRAAVGLAAALLLVAPNAAGQSAPAASGGRGAAKSPEARSADPASEERDRLLLPPANTGPDPVQPTLMLVTAGIALTSIGLGSTFGGLALSKWDDVQLAAQNGCADPGGLTGCTNDVRELQVRASSFATVSTFCFIAGSAALVGTAILWLTTPSSDGPPPRRVAIAPVVGAHELGAAVRGDF